MKLSQIFEQERSRYVQFLVETTARITAESKRVVGELLLSINNEAIPYPYRYVRVDIMSDGLDGLPKPAEVVVDVDEAFEARGFNFGAFAVEVYPFTWNSIQVLVNGPIKDLRQLEGWITRWLDVESENPPGPFGTSQAIHSFSQVESQDGWWYLTGDFGTAPADALSEFIELLAGQGMTRIVIRSGR